MRFLKLRKGTACVSLYCMMVASILFATGVTGESATVASADNGIALPVLMYHSVLKDPEKTGKYVVQPASIDADFAYLTEHGYVAVLPSQVIAYTRGQARLPDKPILITFDDGYLNNLTYLPALLEKHDMKALISVVGEYTQRFTEIHDPNPNYAHMTWKETAQLAATGRVEIGNHTYAMHRQEGRAGAMRKPGESQQAYASALCGDVNALQQALAQYSKLTPQVFAYPYGFISKEADSLLREMGFAMSLSCYETVSMITESPDSLWSLGRYNRDGRLSTDTFMQQIGLQ